MWHRDIARRRFFAVRSVKFMRPEPPNPPQQVLEHGSRDNRLFYRTAKMISYPHRWTHRLHVKLRPRIVNQHGTRCVQKTLFDNISLPRSISLFHSHVSHVAFHKDRSFDNHFLRVKVNRAFQIQEAIMVAPLPLAPMCACFLAKCWKSCTAVRNSLPNGTCRQSWHRRRRGRGNVLFLTTLRSNLCI